MTFSASTAVILAILAPAVVFYHAFIAAARIRRQTRSEPIVLASALTVAGAVATITAATIIDIVPGREPYEALLKALQLIQSNAAHVEQGAIRDAIGWYLSVLALASIIAGAAGFALSKAVVWGAVPFSGYHGPLYPFFRGFLRRYVIAVVVTRLELSDKRYLAYAGILSDLVLSTDHSVSFITLNYPVKSEFAAEWGVPHIRGGGPIRGLPEAMEHLQTDVLADSLLIEGEDIQNAYFIKLAAGPAQPTKEWLIDLLGLGWGYFWPSASRPAPTPGDP